MSEGQTKRRIGQGMKPRDKQAEPVNREAEVEVELQELPTGEGQQESILEPILARQEGELSGDHLEPKTVQILDSEETVGVAQSDGWNIEELMLQSAGAEPVEPVVTDLTPAQMDATAEKMGNQFLSEIMEDRLEQIKFAIRPPGRLKLDFEGKLAVPPPFGGKVFGALGYQADGSYKIITTIPEGYLQAVKDWADSDGVTLEEWVDRQLSSYLEGWGSPAKGR